MFFKSLLLSILIFSGGALVPQSKLSEVELKAIEPVKMVAVNSLDIKESTINQVDARIKAEIEAKRQAEIAAKKKAEAERKAKLLAAQKAEAARKAELQRQARLAAQKKARLAAMKTASTSTAKYSLRQFMFQGVIYSGGNKFTYYSQSVLPGYGLRIPGRHVNANGFVADGNGYIVLSSKRPKGTIISTPFGAKGKVYDYCASCTLNWYDVYIR